MISSFKRILLAPRKDAGVIVAQATGEEAIAIARSRKGLLSVECLLRARHNQSTSWRHRFWSLAPELFNLEFFRGMDA